MPLNADNSEVSNDNVHVLRYNMDWMYSAFGSRATAEALLSPERESGNLTTRDYDAAIKFLPGLHRYYPKIGFTTGIAVGFGIQSRYVRLRGLKQLPLFAITTLSGYIVGIVQQLYVHANYLNNIENPDGYKRAMDNVQKYIPAHRGIILARPYRISPDDASLQPTSEHVDIPSESSPSPDSSSTERSQSKWDQIRATNSRTAHSSAWDALRRQQHEKVRVKPNPQDRDDDKWTSENSDG